MTDPQADATGPQTLWQQSDRLLSGGAVAVRGVAMPHDGESRGAVALTVRVPEGHFQVDSGDGSATATVLVGPGEALGISRWLREAAQAADQAGPPLYDWTPDEP